ncbi:Methionine synthase vitamin-B12 independent [Nitrosococcus halophilus Nc 4]|uniref:Methionine synthase vitamin-B12 independent n=1 Tax=Nitrosococcus halophilus (strain Nc4) TaxID=472759 RepID=D5BWG9_NITHN|nr:cobalamin-independent methionine synthase II family protein [Nitrosococcus halophilus]ADE15626.1 Methionine synthase vitamin-B12 independent [Nitrosococcus halophilus Nc 4]
MSIPTEAVGSIPRPPELLALIRQHREGSLPTKELEAAYDVALRETIQALEATGSPIITDGEQTKSSFATYPLQDLANITADGIVIPFQDGHTRRLPRLTAGPFRYGVHAETYTHAARRYATVPIKQAVISASALSLIYPPEDIDGYPREEFLDDLVREAIQDIHGCFDAGAHRVQIDFTEGRLSVKLDPTKQLLQAFIDLNNRVLASFSPEQRQRIGVHTCPGGDQDSTHSADVDYAELLPSLFKLEAGNFYVQMASEKDPERVLSIIARHLRPQQRVFIGVINVLDPHVESPETVRDRVLQAAAFIPVHQLGTTDDCGFSPFEDDTSTGRETAFAKIRARVIGTKLAAKALKLD